MVGTRRSGKTELERWLKPFLDRLGTRRGADVSALYLWTDWSWRSQERPADGGGWRVGYDQLHHFIADGVWDSAPLEAELLEKADRLVGGRMRVWSSTTPRCRRKDPFGWCCSAICLSLGKTANCQSLVSLTLASREVPVMVGLRLFLPESWTMILSA